MIEMGLVAFSFALLEENEEPNPCNIRLAEAVERIVGYQAGQILVVSQWEIAKKLRQDGFRSALVVGPKPDGSYLDSRDVWEEARTLFGQTEVSRVIVVANQFVHSGYVKRMVKADGYTIETRYDSEIGSIGFDKESLQWWTKSPYHFLLATALMAVGLKRLVHS